MTLKIVWSGNKENQNGYLELCMHNARTIATPATAIYSNKLLMFPELTGLHSKTATCCVSGIYRELMQYNKNIYYFAFCLRTQWTGACKTRQTRQSVY